MLVATTLHGGIGMMDTGNLTLFGVGCYVGVWWGTVFIN